MSVKNRERRMKNQLAARYALSLDGVTDTQAHAIMKSYGDLFRRGIAQQRQQGRPTYVWMQHSSEVLILAYEDKEMPKDAIAVIMVHMSHPRYSSMKQLSDQTMSAAGGYTIQV